MTWRAVPVYRRLWAPGIFFFFFYNFIKLIDFQVQTCSPASISGGRTSITSGNKYKYKLQNIYWVLNLYRKML